MTEEQVEELTPRQKHLSWCKQRALEFSAKGDYKQAVESMISDLGKEDETRHHPAIELGVWLMMSGHLGTRREVDDFIEGVN